MTTTLWYVVVMGLATSAVFFALASVMVEHSALGPDARGAKLAFAVWWFTLGVQQVVAAARIPFAVAEAPLTLMIGLTFVSLAAVTIGLAGLLYYLVYLYTGRSLVSWPILLLYTAYCGWAIQYIGSRRPSGYAVTTWGVTTEFLVDAGAREATVALLALVGPQFVAVLGLLVLARRLPPSASRVRVLVVALSIGVWFATALAERVLALGSDGWHAFRVIVPMLAGLAVLVVYRPPSWLVERLPDELPAATDAAG